MNKLIKANSNQGFFGHPVSSWCSPPNGPPNIWDTEIRWGVVDPPPKISRGKTCSRASMM